MSSLPKEVMPVVRWIRRTVPQRPDLRRADTYRGGRDCVRFGGKCPLGMIPTADNVSPEPQRDSFEPRPPKRITESLLEEFTDWWDWLTLDEAREAAKLIWPERKKQAK
jgi:hypothetical protein